MSKQNIILLVIVVLILIASGVGGYYYINETKPSVVKTEIKEENVKQKGVNVISFEKTEEPINLDRYLKSKNKDNSYASVNVKLSDSIDKIFDKIIPSESFLITTITPYEDKYSFTNCKSLATQQDYESTSKEFRTLTCRSDDLNNEFEIGIKKSTSINEDGSKNDIYQLYSILNTRIFEKSENSNFMNASIKEYVFQSYFPKNMNYGSFYIFEFHDEWVD